MDWQSLFDKLNNRRDVLNNVSECLHEDCIEEDGFDTCVECGTMIRRKLCLSKQFSDNVFVRKIKSRCAIFSDIPDEFDPSVKHLAVVMYKTVTAKKIFRCSQRKAILAACVHRASVWLKAPSTTCFSSFNLTNSEINKGVTFVSCHLALDEYNIPLYSIEEEITKNCLDFNISSPSTVVSIYSKINQGCEELISSSQRKSIIFTCIWLYLKIFDEKLSIDIETFSNRASISCITVEKKYCTMMKYILSRIMKSICAWSLDILRCDESWDDKLCSNTPRIPVTLKHYDDHELMTMIADDGFVYPLEDVDDVDDWNILFDMTFENGTCRKIKIPISINCKLKNVKVSFDKPLQDCGPRKLKNSIIEFLLKV